MIVLGIETSCDETSAALIKANKKISLLTNVVASSLSLHAKTGGVIPEIAAREQIKYIIPVIDEATRVLKNPKEEIDLIAVTMGPGLIGSLLVGVETAKTLSYAWKKPIVGVNHLFGHIYANWINLDKSIAFPAISLVISGGHTDLVLLKNHNDILWIGGTRDDAAGEAFDKTGRLMGLNYPAGPEIEKLAKHITEDKYKFPRPLIHEKNFEFSFSGLKTAVLREIQKIKSLNENDIKNISYSMQNSIFDVVTKKTLDACTKYGVRSLLIGGGVAANQSLKDRFNLEIKKRDLKISLYIPEKYLCTDNAGMIATAGYFSTKRGSWKEINANPELYFD